MCGRQCDSHAREIKDFISFNESQRLVVGFSADIDCAGAAPIVKVTIRFANSVSDSLSQQLADPNQMPLLDEDDDYGKVVARGKGDGE